MRIVNEFPRPVREIEHLFIELADGCRLATRIAMVFQDPMTALNPVLTIATRQSTSSTGCKRPGPRSGTGRSPCCAASASRSRAPD
jgi:hypothetical protein